VVIDFIDMVLESNRELVLRRLTECLGRDRTKHQVTEITSLGLVQMTRKRIGSGLLEAFSETCDHCKGRGLVIHTEPVPEKRSTGNGAVSQVRAVAAATRTEQPQQQPAATKSRRRRGSSVEPVEAAEPILPVEAVLPAEPILPAEPVEPVVAVVSDVEDPMAIAAEFPPPVVQAGSGIVNWATASPAKAASDDEYDISGYDLSRYEAPEPVADAEPLQLTGLDDPDAAEDDDEDDDDEPVGAGAGGRRRSRRGGSRRRTRP
jgi:ribonuclease E